MLFDVGAGVLAEPEAAQIDETPEVADLVEVRDVVLADEQLLERPAVLEVAQAVYFVDAETDKMHRFELTFKSGIKTPTFRQPASHKPSKTRND